MNATEDQMEGTAPAQHEASGAPREHAAPPEPARASQPSGQAPPGYAPVSSSVLDANDPRRKNPALAGILSAMPGLGQIYVGYYPRGFAHAVAVASMIALLNTGQFRGLEPLIGMFLAFFWLYNIIDAMRRASLYNQVLAGGDVPLLPDEFRMPSMGGSIFGGVVLLGAGFVLLLHTRFGMPLDFLEEWWPVIPMMLGAYLLTRALRDRAVRDESSGRRSRG